MNTLNNEFDFVLLSSIDTSHVVYYYSQNSEKQDHNFINLYSLETERLS